MSALRDNPWISTLAALALTIAVGATLLFGVARPLIDRCADADAEIADLATQLQRFRAAAAQPSAPSSPIVVADRALLDAPSAGMAAARLQDIATRAVDVAGGAIDSIRIEPPAPYGPAEKIPMTLELSIDAAGLQSLLHRLETHVPYVFVERLDARRLRDGDPSSSRAALRLRIFGLARRDEEG